MKIEISQLNTDNLAKYLEDPREYFGDHYVENFAALFDYIYSPQTSEINKAYAYVCLVILSRQIHKSEGLDFRANTSKPDWWFYSEILPIDSDKLLQASEITQLKSRLVLCAAKSSRWVSIVVELLNLRMPKVQPNIDVNIDVMIGKRREQYTQKQGALQYLPDYAPLMVPYGLRVDSFFLYLPYISKCWVEPNKMFLLKILFWLDNTELQSAVTSSTDPMVIFANEAGAADRIKKLFSGKNITTEHGKSAVDVSEMSDTDACLLKLQIENVIKCAAAFAKTQKAYLKYIKAALPQPTWSFWGAAIPDVVKLRNLFMPKLLDDMDPAEINSIFVSASKIINVQTAAGGTSTWRTQLVELMNDYKSLLDQATNETMYEDFNPSIIFISPNFIPQELNVDPEPAMAMQEMQEMHGSAKSRLSK